ncbi:MAG: site-specific integrase [Bacteroidales bacterium]|nr:site-specific integrase [Bacteroidales bacterium]
MTFVEINAGQQNGQQMVNKTWCEGQARMAITVGKYHLFERKRRGQVYFYYWYEAQGKRIQKACGHGCDDKRSAVAYLEQLLKADLTEARRQSSLSSITVRDFAKDMFTEGAPHLARWAAKGKVLKRQTIIQHRRHLTGYLLSRFGRLRFTEITPTAVEDFLLEQQLSNSCRNTILYTLKLIMQEASREGILESVPDFEPFKRSGRRQDVLSGEELTKLFPWDEKELVRIWTRPDDKRKERDTNLALMFGTLFCVTVSAGLRSGEIRALHQDQISIANSGLVIDRAVDDRGEIGPLKKATEEDSRSRAVIIPEITLKMLERWLGRVPESSGYPGLVFSYHEKPIANYYILDRFRYGLENAGIDYEKRRLTVHCLRYTYNTRMRTLLSEQVLREFVGHRSIAMTDHYDNPILLERLAAYQSVKPSVEQFWG